MGSGCDLGVGDTYACWGGIPERREQQVQLGPAQHQVMPTHAVQHCPGCCMCCCLTGHHCAHCSCPVLMAWLLDRARQCCRTAGCRLQLPTPPACRNSRIEEGKHAADHKFILHHIAASQWCVSTQHKSEKRRYARLPSAVDMGAVSVPQLQRPGSGDSL